MEQNIKQLKLPKLFDYNVYVIHGQVTENQIVNKLIKHCYTWASLALPCPMDNDKIG